MRDGIIMGTFRNIDKSIAEIRSEQIKTNTVVNALIVYLSHRKSFELKWKWMEMLRKWFTINMGLIDVGTLQKFIIARVQEDQRIQAAEIKKAREEKNVKQNGKKLEPKNDEIKKADDKK